MSAYERDRVKPAPAFYSLKGTKPNIRTADIRRIIGEDPDFPGFRVNSGYPANIRNPDIGFCTQGGPGHDKHVEREQVWQDGIKIVFILLLFFHAYILPIFMI